MIRPVTGFVIGPSGKVQVVDVFVPLPAYVTPASEPPLQSNAYWNVAAVSALDGSNGLVSESWKLEPSLTGPVLANVALGGTLLTVTEPLYSVSPPSLSRTFAFTDRVPLSVVGQVATFEEPKVP